MSRSLFALLAILCFGLGSTALGNQRPNVLMILTDDQGSRDLRCYGAKDLTTPHLDQLAASGVRFNHFYAAAPVCGPSRAALLTGLHPWLATVQDNVGTAGQGLPSRFDTMAEHFKRAGYTTAHVGKWHLGHHRDTLPNAQGFDYSFGHHGGCIDNYSHYFYWNGPNKHDLYENGKEVFHPGRFFPELMRERALQFTAQSKQPFFLYYALNLPHYPYQAPTRWISHYRSAPMPRRLYAAAVSAADENLGQLIQGLKQQGKFENTIIAFMSDHGHSTEIRAFGGGGYSGGLRGAKFSLFEGGIRVPAIITYPKSLPQGEQREQMATGCDWLPTLLDLCQIPYPADQLTGQSLLKVIQNNQKSPHTHLRWKHNRQRSVRKGDWKLLENPVDTSHRSNPGQAHPGLYLYNLKQDPAESVNLIQQHPTLAKELQSQLP